MSENDEKVKRTAAEVADHLDDILLLFKPGVHIAIVVWHPESLTRDFVLHSPETTLEAVVETLQRRIAERATDVTGRTKDVPR